MTVAELFIKIGLKGDGQVKKGLTDVNKGLKDIGSSSMAAKAGILAMFYGLERLTGMASQMGMDLKKFSTITGLSAQELQKWQYVAQTYDVSADEMAQTVRGLQSTITDMMLGKGMPEGAAALGIKMTRDPFNLLKQLAHAAKTLPPDIASSLIKSFGFSDNVIQMLMASKMNMGELSKRDMLDNGEIDRLTLINKKWKDIWFTLKMFGTKMVAKNGMMAVEPILNVIKLLRDAADGVGKLTMQFSTLKTAIIAVGLAIGIAFAPISTLVVGLTFLLSEIQKFREGKQSVIGDVLQEGEQAHGNLDKTGGVGGIGDRLKNHKMDMLKATMGDVMGIPLKIGEWTGLRDKTAVPASTQASAEQRATAGKDKPSAPMTATVNNYGVEHPKQTGEATSKGVSKAFRQMSAQAGGV